MAKGGGSSCKLLEAMHFHFQPSALVLDIHRVEVLLMSHYALNQIIPNALKMNAYLPLWYIYVCSLSAQKLV